MEFEQFFDFGFGMVLFYLMYALVGLAIGIASYVLRAIGVYTIAKRRGIKRPWMAWVPVVDQYMLGCVSDQYQYVVKGKNKSKRNVLLWLNIGMVLLSLGVIVSYVVLAVNVAQAMMRGATENDLMQLAMSPAAGMLGMSLPMLILSIVTAVFRYMALYDLYTSCTPMNNVMFLVLSIVFNVTEPFFIFFSRNKDQGMPPRKTEATAEPVVEAVPEEQESAPEVDPWDRPDIE